jgi:cell division protease FtsH
MTDSDDREREPQSGDDPKMSRRNRGLFSFLAVCVLILLVIWIFAHQIPNQGQKMSWIEFWQALYRGDLESVEIVGKNKVTGILLENELGTRKRKFEVVFPEKALEEQRSLIEERALLEREKVAKGEMLRKLRDPDLILRRVLEIQYDGSREIELDFFDPEVGYSRVWFYRTETPREPVQDLFAAARQHAEETGRTVAFDVKRLQNPGDRSLTYSSPNTFFLDLLLSLAPWLLIFGLFWFFIVRQMKVPGGSGGVLAFGKSRARLHTKEQSNVTFADVAGIEEAKEEVKEIIEFLKNPGKFQRIGGRIPRGVLLVGPPGTGKTLLAKAIAGEADVPFFSISGSDFVEMFVGVGASRVRDLFKQAKENSPCIVFLDEIDAVGRRRGAGLGGGHDEREQTLNAILVEMDGFDTDEGIILIAATNRPDVLDPALLRPGRFDREIVIDLPDLAGREAILKVHAQKIKLAPEVDLKVLARGTPMFSGADLEATINEAALLAVLKGKDAADMEDLEEARDKVKWGRKKTSKIMDPEEKVVTAYHEAGHALVACLLPEVEPLHKVTIIPRGAALGATMQLPEKDKYVHRKRELLGDLALLFGGRVAEELCCEDVSSGAQNDIQRATELARLMVTEWGMSDAIGPVNYSESEETLFLGREITRTRSHSEATAVEIDKEVRRILQEAYDRTRQLLTTHLAELERLKDALVAHEVLNRKEVDAILEGKDLRELRAAEESRAKEKTSPRPTSSETEHEEYGADPEKLGAEGEFAF